MSFNHFLGLRYADYSMLLLHATVLVFSLNYPKWSGAQFYCKYIEVLKYWSSSCYFFIANVIVVHHKFKFNYY